MWGRKKIKNSTFREKITTVFAVVGAISALLGILAALVTIYSYSTEPSPNLRATVTSGEFKIPTQLDVAGNNFSFDVIQENITKEIAPNNYLETSDYEYLINSISNIIISNIQKLDAAEFDEFIDRESLKKDIINVLSTNTDQNNQFDNSQVESLISILYGYLSVINSAYHVQVSDALNLSNEMIDEIISDEDLKEFAYEGFINDVLKVVIRYITENIQPYLGYGGYWQVFLVNEGDATAENVQLTLPKTEFVEIKHQNNIKVSKISSPIITIGALPAKESREIFAWTNKYSSLSYDAEDIALVYKSGIGKVDYYAELDPFYQFIDRWKGMTPFLLSIILLLYLLYLNIFHKPKSSIDNEKGHS